jgi:hypothetical protein
VATDGGADSQREVFGGGECVAHHTTAHSFFEREQLRAARLAFDELRGPRVIVGDQEAEQRLAAGGGVEEFALGDRHFRVGGDEAVAVRVDADDQVAGVDLRERGDHRLVRPRPEHLHPADLLAEPVQRVRDRCPVRL